MKTLDDAVADGFAEFKKRPTIAKIIEADAEMEDLLYATFLCGVSVGGQNAMELTRDLLNHIREGFPMG